MAAKVLLIEDDPFLSEIYTAKFEEAGFAVVFATDGYEGLRKVKSELPSCILIDIVMPTMDGYDVLRAVRNDAELKDIPIIILSNLGEESDVRRGIELGAIDYLIKAHYTPTEVVARIKSILEKT